MNNNILLTYLVNILPKLTLSFVGILLLYKLYFRIRSNYSIKVNCWFCNTNSKVPYLAANSWICSKCEQYNGFNKEGDYNREIKEQFECNTNSVFNDTHRWLRESAAQNGFCDACNEAQRLKIEKLSQFEPKRESRFDDELKIYQAELEQQFRLCVQCDRHLKKTLRNKKKMVLGSKFLEYIMKSAEAFKDPQLQNMRFAQQIIWKRRLSLLITFLTLINLICLSYVLPTLNRAWFENVFGTTFGTQIFILCSHVVALWRVLLSFITTFLENETITRFGLFARTIFMMLLYSLGLRLPQIVRLNFTSLYLLAAPFCILATIFSYHVIDKFKLTRYTILLALWSLYAGGLLEQSTNNVQQCLMFLACIVTTILTGTSKVETSPKLFDRTASSFHKIYADDYASDLDTAGSSTLDYQLDCSTLSTQSDISHSFASLKRSTLRPFDRKSPLSSSTLSLNLTPRQPMRTNVPVYGMKSPLTSSTFSLNQASNNTTSKSFFNADGNSTIRPRVSNSVLNSTFGVANNFNASNRSFAQVEQPNSSFLTSNNSFTQPSMKSVDQLNNKSKTPMPAPSLRSAFSASTTALNNFERPSRLLTPSRFSLQSQTIGFANCNSSFNATGNIFEQAKEPSANITRPCSNLSAINENLSRASSRSSGFESQNGVMNNSRENSCGLTEPVNEFTSTDRNLQAELQNKTFSLDNSRSFQPIDYSRQLNNGGGIDNTFSLLSLHQPLSVNCSAPWQSTSSRINTNLFNSPSLKRGDLLRKWKEGGIAMT